MVEDCEHSIAYVNKDAKKFFKRLRKRLRKSMQHFKFNYLKTTRTSFKFLRHLIKTNSKN